MTNESVKKIFKCPKCGQLMSLDERAKSYDHLQGIWLCPNPACQLKVYELPGSTPKKNSISSIK